MTQESKPKMSLEQALLAPAVMLNFTDRPSVGGNLNLYSAEVVEALREHITQELEAGLKRNATAQAEFNQEFREPGWFIPEAWLGEAERDSLGHLIARHKVSTRTTVTIDPGMGMEVTYDGAFFNYAYRVEPEALFRNRVIEAIGGAELGGTYTDDEIIERLRLVVDSKQRLAVDRAATLFDAIKHGDEAHQEWLRQAITAHFAGEPIPGAVMSSDKSSQTWVAKLGAAAATLNEPVLIHRVTQSQLQEKYKRLMQQCGHPNSEPVLGAMRQLVNEITFNSMSLADAVIKASDMTQEELEATEPAGKFWGHREPAEAEPMPLQERQIELQHQAVRTFGALNSTPVKQLGTQAGVVKLVNGRLVFWDMGSTRAADGAEWPVYFEAGQMPELLQGLAVTKYPVTGVDSIFFPYGAPSQAVSEVLTGEAALLALRNQLRKVGVGPEQDARSEAPATPKIEQLDPTELLGLTVDQLKAFGAYVELLDDVLFHHVSDSWFGIDGSVDPAVCTDVVVSSLKAHYVKQWLKENVGVKAAPSTPVFSDEALADPTKIQKALVMGLHGDEVQQLEARQFLKQYLNKNTGL